MSDQRNKQQASQSGHQGGGEQEPGQQQHQPNEKPDQGGRQQGSGGQNDPNTKPGTDRASHVVEDVEDNRASTQRNARVTFPALILGHDRALPF